MAASPYEHTLIETQIHIKQSRKTHKTDAKKRKEYCLRTIQSKLLQETSDASDNSYVQGCRNSGEMGDISPPII